MLRPGEYMLAGSDIVANAGRSVVSVRVANAGDRPIQVGSHAHFFEVNKALSFPRKEGYGRHLNIPSGTSVRFEPGDVKQVELVDYGGRRVVYGFSGLVNGSLDGNEKEALQRAQEAGFT